ncbi:MAG: glycoside hydrolase family 92 protein [Clostridia bacterium]|nr:glycoside hydrolase family 92 protein [Clostridia bacterium]
MKTDYCKYVNVFQGTGEIDLPEPRGVAARWKLIKGLCGSNTPAAALPFGRINAGCYSGGYSAGYGHLMYNTHGPIKKLYDKDKFKGISHLQNDGTGDIDTFYNYAVISPYAGDLSESAEARDFTDESAQPGYYACRDASTGALCEVTVTRRAALHRITFPKDTGCISIDFSNDGLYEDGGHLHSPAGSARLALIGDDECAVCARLHGIDIYFCVSVKGARGSMRLWRDHAEIDERELTLDAGHTFGVTFSCARIAEITLALSPKSEYVALRDARGNAFSFDKARRAAYDEWNQTLSRLACEFDDPRDYEIFYSNLYHSLLKPCDFSGESFLYEGEDFVSELATIWDQYKTQLPLVYMLYPEMPHRIVNTFLNICEATHKMPHTLMLYGEYAGVSTGQARMLAEFSIADAYLRGVDFDVERALRLMEADTFEYNHFDELAAQPENVRSKAFIIDITDACAACALVARSRGDTRLAERFEKVASLWSGVFDRETGLLQDGERFYEGSKWNYSFRLMHDMEGRAALAGGKKALRILRTFSSASHRLKAAATSRASTTRQIWKLRTYTTLRTDTTA